MSPAQPILLAALALASDLEPKVWEHPYETDAERVPALATGGNCLIRDALIHTAVRPAFRGDVLVRAGKIERIGTGLDAPDGFAVIEAAGRHLAPGVIDPHSHIAIDDVNEGTASITADCDIGDVLSADDVSIYRALAGGTTAQQCLHGSANAIGGRSEVIKLKWEVMSDELRFTGAPQGIKFALGENPKQSNIGSQTTRFPDSRMGIEALYVRAFERAREYQRGWEDYEAERARGEDPPPPRRDVRLEVLAGILAGTVQVHSHCYRADEILMLMRVMERFGVRVQTFQHVLEGYKVAREMAQHGVGGSTFSDWWAYKIEAYDAIPQNAALMAEAGVLATVNSDSAELIRHLTMEAGKSVACAGMDRVQALCLATLNAARQLGVGERVGSIEVGKDADLALYSGDPLSFTSRCELTLVDGEVEFQRRDAFGLDAAPLAARDLGVAPRANLDPDPGAGPVTAIVGGTLHPATSPAIEDGTLILQGERILALGRGLAVPAGAATYDARGKHVWPGLIALDTNLGLREIDSVRGTDDQAEIGGDQPDLRTAAAIHPDSAHIPVTRTAGVTRAQVAPQGGGPLMGQSAVIRLDGETWEELLAVDRDMLHVAFPRAANVEPAGRDKKKKEKPDAVKELARWFTSALEYGRRCDAARAAGGTGDAPAWDARLEALVPYARGEKVVALHADNAQTILWALEFAREHALDAVLFGATEGWKVVDVLAREQVPVVVGPVLDIPGGFDPYDACYANPAVLFRAGVPFAIACFDDENVRTLPYHAATASAYGLPREEALRAITIYAARVLGIEERTGSLEAGKLADLIVTSGDVLDTTVPVEAMWIQGERQDLGNRQTALYERYRARLRGG
jgi:imidazolonepropionase-like amidohydrolase